MQLATIAATSGGTINGGAGTDTLIVNYSDYSSGIVNQSDRIRSTGFNNLLFFSNNIEKFNITGSQNDDSLTVFRADDILDGAGANDTLSLSLANVTTSVSVNFSNTQNQVTYGNVSVKNFEYVGTLTLGIGDDTVQLATIAATSGGTINGGAGTDTLIVNYSDYSSGIVTESDRIRSTGFNNLLFFSNIEKFEITGTQINDSLAGKSDNDTLIGLGGNDSLKGNNGNDILIGTYDGSQEQDYLEGGTGNDRFILADTTKTFYDDGNSTLPGDNDYATIADFNTTDDIIQLRGSSSNYLLSVSGSNTKLYINKPGSEPDELIAVINNQTALSLTASYFSYVASPTLPSITLAVSPASVTEDGTTNLVYTFTRTGVTTNPLTVNYTLGGTATLNTDYTRTGTTNTVTFAAGSATATVTVDPTADTTVESDETVALTLATGTGYTVGTTTAVTGTINNDDTRVTLAVSPASVTEDGTTNLVYTFTRTGVTTNALTVNYTLGGTATLNTDYTRTGTTNTVTFAAGSSTATVTVDPTADTTVESDETVALTLATGTGYTVGTTTAVTGTINNDDTRVTLAVSPASVTEDGTTNLVYTFTRTGVTTNALTVNYTLGGTATLNTDYTRTGTTNTVTFAAGSSTATVTVNPTADTIVEPNETVILTLASGTGYTVGTPNAVTGTITNDDVTLPSITLAVSPASVTEDGTTNLVYTFTRSGSTTNSLIVNYTLGGTATLNTDYTRTGTTNTVTFAAGSSTATVTVNPTADTIVEPNETVILTLASGTGYTVGTPNAVTGTITNDDVTLPSITLAVSPASVTEDGTTNLVYTFTRSGSTTNSLIVNYTLGGTATLNTDYTRTGTTNTVTFAAGSSTATVTVNPTADTTIEPNETVILTLASGTGYTVGTPNAVTGTITNDDNPGRIQGLKWNDINGNGVREDLIQGNPPDIVFVIDVSGSTSSPFQGLAVGDVNNDGTANTRLDAEIAGFIALNNRLVSQGLGSARISIVSFESSANQRDMNPTISGIQLTTNPATDSNNNGIRDVEEILRSLVASGGTNFEIALQKATNTLTSIGTTTGNGNVIFISDGENNAGGSYSDEVLTLQNAGVKLSAFGVGTNANISNLQVINPNASIFTSTDQLLGVFDGLGSGSQSFKEPGLGGVSIYLDLNNNGVLDAGEPTQVTAVDNPSTTNIDEAGQYSFTNVQPGTYIVREVVPSGFSQTFPNSPNYHTVVVGSGQTVNNINFGNTTPSPVTLTVNPVSVAEDGTTNLVYTFTRTGNLTNALTVNYSVAGTATLNTDYSQTGAATFTSTTGTITLAAGLSTATLTIDPTADTTIEPNETVILTLASGTGYTVGTPNAATGTITNDDFFQLSISDIITVVEGKDNNAILTVTINNPNPQPITFNYTTAPINATANVDYTSKTGTITIAPNTSTTNITIPILNDNLNEADEAFTVTLSNPVNATINPEGGIGEVIITDTWQSSLTRTLPNNVENLRLIGSNNINGTGNAGNNNITGNSGINQINGGAGIDTLTGGLGADTFVFQFGQSTISTSDRITDFAINSDKIDLLTQGGLAMSAPSNFSRAANSTVTTLQNLINQVFTDANGATIGNQGLGVNSAALVQVTTSAIAGTYLVINDSTAGFQSSNDLLINITGFTGTLPALGSILVGNFFI
ncbi:poly(beta-D-mannuronate) C5 epimerase 5 [Microcystis aeruginosa Sj]|uniref:Poly(Beta-D-mannuronate) C5 epimerase 5 n=2 Tax=Microcystis aeruginosa TaxID=1126 RepID=A0A2Z6UMR0_MICAE|nr:Calx-beta domain-containing protein [Microcystis aeruginosa]GBL10997.1 poly(beta-D-mannuronate) C5 epimerase 5 [Microcystis aeruginosa Sj]